MMMVGTDELTDRPEVVSELLRVNILATFSVLQSSHIGGKS